MTPVVSSPVDASACFIRVGRANELPIAVDIDQDACTAYVELDPRFAVDLGDDHPFTRAERARWSAAASADRLLFACDPARTPVGLLVLDELDGAPYIEQVSVRRAWGRRGIGRMLLDYALRWSAGADLWLTTYDHVPWNRPWYERLGFVAVPDAPSGVERRAVLDFERASLPDPDHRIAMVHRTR